VAGRGRSVLSLQHVGLRRLQQLRLEPEPDGFDGLDHHTADGFDHDTVERVRSELGLVDERGYGHDDSDPNPDHDSDPNPDHYSDPNADHDPDSDPDSDPNSNTNADPDADHAPGSYVPGRHDPGQPADR
jgi:hypothetical protein